MIAPLKRAAALVCLAAALAVAPAAADPRPSANAEARTHFERGRQLYSEGNFGASLTEFQRAYELAPTYKLWPSIAQAYRQQNDYVGAVQADERYLREGGNEIPPKRRAEVEKEIAAMRLRVAMLTVSVDADGADVSIDEVPVGRSPLAEALPVNVGRHRLVASKGGRQGEFVVVDVAGGDALTVTLTVGASGASAPGAAAPRVAPATPAEPTRRVPWVAWGVTGVLAAGAAATGAFALSSSSSLSRDRAGPTSRASLDHDRARTTSFAIAADVLGGAALVAGGVSLYLTLSPPKSDATGALTPSLRASIGPRGAALDGSF